VSDCTERTCPHHGDANRATCGQRALAISNAYYGPTATVYYTKPCILPRGHGTHHKDADGYTWHETAR
jgi:hypothetical protein